jgi:hypothetical protein
MPPNSLAIAVVRRGRSRNGGRPDKDGSARCGSGPYYCGMAGVHQGGAWLGSIGHSNHQLSQFLGLVADADIEVVADVRSTPRSVYAPWFERDTLRASLTASGVRYVFLGDALGGRPASPAMYDAEGRVRYDLVAVSPSFRAGLVRLLEGCASFRVAMMCAEENPSACHRRLLIARAVEDLGVDVVHVRGDGSCVRESELTQQDRQDQMSLFGQEDPRPWRSIRSVSPSGPRKASSEH